MFSRIVELSLRHLAEVGEQKRGLKLYLLLDELYRTTTKHGDLQRLQSDYGAIFGQLVNLDDSGSF